MGWQTRKHIIGLDLVSVVMHLFIVFIAVINALQEQSVKEGRTLQILLHLITS